MCAAVNSFLDCFLQSAILYYGCAPSTYSTYLDSSVTHCYRMFTCIALRPRSRLAKTQILKVNTFDDCGLEYCSMLEA